MINNSQRHLSIVAQEIAGLIQKSRASKQYFDHPFQHIVIDDCFPANMARRCILGFPVAEDKSWDHSSDVDVEIKSRSNWKSEFDIPEEVLPIVRVLNSSAILSSIGQAFGIGKLVPDPYFSGGGLNVTKRDGLLDVHVDGNYHDETGLNRRVNVLLYLNEEWEPEWGGELGLYSEDGEVCLKKIAPLFNRLFIFETHDKSFHGLPDPLAFPAGKHRRSVILYYYTKESRPSEQVVISEPHSALWKKRGLLDKRGYRARKFK